MGQATTGGHTVTTAAPVLCMHGIANGIDPSRFVYRNLLERDEYRQFLSSVAPFVSIADALAGRGTALTIDDATRACADAALMARALGHHVTLFVNPGQVESGAPYHFLLLNVLLDALDGTQREFAGRRYRTATTKQRQLLRLTIKDSLRAIAGEPERVAFLADLSARWKVPAMDLPPFLQTLTPSDLRALLDAGVDLQNHGWSHSHHANLTPAESAREIREGREWLRRELGVDAGWFAAPFGDSRPHRIDLDCDAWFTLNAAWHEGWLAPKVYNRRELTVPFADALRPSAARSLLRRMTERISAMLRT